MAQHISAAEARERLEALLDDVARTGAEYVIERAGEPAAAIIPVQIYRQHLKDRGDAFDRVEALRQRLTQDETVEGLEDAINDATENVRNSHQ